MWHNTIHEPPPLLHVDAEALLRDIQLAENQAAFLVRGNDGDNEAFRVEVVEIPVDDTRAAKDARNAALEAWRAADEQRRESMRLEKQMPSLMKMCWPKFLTEPRWVGWRDSESACLLHYAARYSPAMLRQLLAKPEFAAHVNCRAQRGVTPLREAVRADQPESVRILVRAGADGFCSARDVCALMECLTTIGHEMGTSFMKAPRNRYEVGVALLTAPRERAVRVTMLDHHKQGCVPHSPLTRDYVVECLGIVNYRCARAYQAVGTALYALRRRMCAYEGGRDVFCYVIAKHLRTIWEERRYEACWGNGFDDEED